MLSFHGYLPPSECWAEAIPAAQNALKYGPDLGETHNALAVIALLYDRSFEDAEREFKRALEVNPTSIQSRVWYGMLYLIFTLGKFEEGYEQFRIAVENDPLSSYVHSCFALSLATGDKYEESIASAEYAVKLDPDSLIARYNLGYCYLWSGQLEKTLEQCQIALKMSSRHAWILHLTLLAYQKLDMPGEALKIFKEMKARHRDFYLPPSNLAIAAAALGKDEYAFELASTGVDIVDPYLPFVVTVLKDGESLRRIPGFEKIQERLGFSNRIPTNK